MEGAEVRPELVTERFEDTAVGRFIPTARAFARARGLRDAQGVPRVSRPNTRRASKEIRDRVLLALGNECLSTGEIARRAGLTRGTVRDALRLMFARRMVEREADIPGGNLWRWRRREP